ncbi:hypothetical protein DFH08DRAFT_827157 [Mycena albidolilacea]|uniref:Uncharacterized protein n=1 Tax=Mycena albidolilacea TaxID=1033008 RepID=A0AAD6YZU6_9AGAR|nr:hypothetical protein DFH08DRAFT_827157 [Mycena albidolilacea]
MMEIGNAETPLKGCSARQSFSRWPVVAPSVVAVEIQEKCGIDSIMYTKAKTGTSVVGPVSTGDAEDLDAEVTVEVPADTEAIPEGENKHKRRPNMRYANFWRHANDMDKDLIFGI